jgi:hypothetical protein
LAEQIQFHEYYWVSHAILVVVFKKAQLFAGFVALPPDFLLRLRSHPDEVGRLAQADQGLTAVEAGSRL